MDQKFRDRIIVGVYFLLIVAVSLIVFYPSFYHTFRADQMVYFANTRQYSDVISLWKNYYAYEHVRYFNPGDAFLFRPLLSMLLCLEKSVFNMDYVYWHMLGLAFHMLAAWFLFRILYELKAGIFAFLGSLFYVCCFANIETVIWEHINSYALFNALILAIFCYFKRNFEEEKHEKLGSILVLLVFCVFLHEFGLFFAVMFGVCFYFKSAEAGKIEYKNKTRLFFLPVFLYLLAYGWVNLYCHGASQAKMQEDQSLKIIQFSNVFHVIKLFPRFVFHMVFSCFFPSQIEEKLNTAERLMVIDKPDFGSGFLLNAMAVCGVILLFFRGFSRAVVEHNKSFLFLLAGMMGVILIILPLIRLPTHGERYVLLTSSYYGYLFLSYFLVFIFMTVDWPKIHSQEKVLLRYLGIASLIILIFLNAHKTWEMNQSIKINMRERKEYIDKLNHFIDMHRQEPGFSIYVKNDKRIALSHKIKDSLEEQTQDYDLASIFYYTYYNPKSPEYIFFMKDGLLQNAK